MATFVIAPARTKDAALIKSVQATVSAAGHNAEVGVGLETASNQARGKRWTMAIGQVRKAIQISAEPVHLVGYSMGCLVAVRAAVMTPGRIASLTLIAPMLEITGQADRAKRAGIDKLVPMLKALEEEAAPGFLEGDILRGRLQIEPLVIQGVHDRMVPPWTGQGRVENLPDGHYFQKTQARVTELVLSRSKLRAGPQ